MSVKNSTRYFRLDSAHPVGPPAETQSTGDLPVASWSREFQQEGTPVAQEPLLSEWLFSIDEWAVLGNQLIFILNSHGKILDVSENLEFVLGHTQVNVQGENLSRIAYRATPKDQRGMNLVKAFLDQLIEQSWVSKFALDLRNAKGEKCSCICRGIVLEASDLDLDQELYLVTATWQQEEL